MFTRKEIAELYSITTATLAKRILAAKIEIKSRTRVTPKEFELIIEELGHPVELREFQKH